MEKAKILIAEDEKAQRDLLEGFLRKEGSSVETVATMKEGALDYLTKPIDLDELLLIFQKVMERSNLIRENKELRAQLQERYTFSNIIYGSPKMNEVMGLVARVAP